MLNTIVQVYLPDDETGKTSRVEGIGRGYIEIANPSPEMETSLKASTEMYIFWRDKRGMYRAPAQLVDIFTERAALWRVRPTGPTERYQRRQFARAELPIDVWINFIDRVPRLEAQVHVVDVSEGGIRCWTNQYLALQTGEQVEVEIPIEGKATIVVGSILRTEYLHDLDDFVIVLNDPVPEAIAMALRQEVFRVERGQRKIK